MIRIIYRDDPGLLETGLNLRGQRDNLARTRELREAFRRAVFERDQYACRVCGFRNEPQGDDANLMAHQICEQGEMPGDGYVIENGITLCSYVGRGQSCHEKAAIFSCTGVALEGWAPEDLYHIIGSSKELAIRAGKMWL